MFVVVKLRFCYYIYFQSCAGRWCIFDICWPRTGNDPRAHLALKLNGTFYGILQISEST